MFAHEFMRNAFLAGTFVALACGLVGCFVVLRAQVFAGDALSHVAFTGALGAAAVGIDIRLGLFAATSRSPSAIGGARRAGRGPTTSSSARSSPGSSVSACSSSRSSSAARAAHGTAAVRVLFGSIFGLSAGDARLAAAIALAACPRPAGDRPAAAVRLARPRGRPRAGSAGAGARDRLLRVLGVVAAEATQAVGALLLLGLLAAPAAPPGCSPVVPGSASPLRGDRGRLDLARPVARYEMARCPRAPP